MTHTNNDASGKKLISRKRLAKAFIASLVVMLIVCSVAYSQTNGVLLQASNFPVLPTDWFSFALVVVLIIIFIAGIVYILSGIIGSEAARNWSRIQIYEGLLSMILLIVFVSVVALFSQNLWPVFYAAGLTAPSTSPYSCFGAADLFQLSTCDLSQFNTLAQGFYQSVFFFGVASAFAPGVQISGDFSAFNIEFGGRASLSSIMPITIEDVEGNVFAVLIVLYIMNQVQILLLSGSLLWLSFFVTLGLVARTLGFSRSFGGAMIALGLGLGFVLPLMASITYGYIDYQVSNPPLSSLGITNYLLQYGITVLVNYLFLNQGYVPPPPATPVLFQLTLLGAGLTFLPFINFTIVDAFIVDLSSAIGERLDFMSLLTGVI